MRIFACGRRSLICVVASMPERLGIRTSISSTSGSCSRIVWRPRRNSAWSSATITRSRSLPALSSSVRSGPSATVSPRWDEASVLVLGFGLPCEFGRSYTFDPRAQASATLAVVIAQLPFELVHEPVDRRIHVLGFGVCSERLARRLERRLDASRADLRGTGLRDDLHLDACNAGLHPLQPSELVFGRITDPLGDLRAAALHDDVHRAPLPCRATGYRGGRSPRPADLVFDP